MRSAGEERNLLVMVTLELMVVALKTLIFTVLVSGTVAVWIPYRLVSSPGSRGSIALGGLRYAGLPGILLRAGIYLWCAWHFTSSGKGTPAPIDPPKHLVVRGPYKYVRNPMYVGVLSLVLGQAIWFQSLILVEYAGPVFLLFNAFVLLYEEPVLSRKFGESYKRYRKNVPRWIPKVRRSKDQPGSFLRITNRSDSRTFKQS